MNRFAKYAVESTGVFIAILLVSLVGDFTQTGLMIAPFGATCVILFSLRSSHFARMRNVVGSYTVCSLAGVASYHIMENTSWSIAFAVGIAVFIMLIADIVHPPACAVTIIAVTTGADWLYIIFPVLSGALMISVIATIYTRKFK
ncbi:HPP family protein [Parasporobacterium paucivorans]|uniref:HPP family protein n=1 Tax=Parasporobacterium paucivorans DSM 15970 TaxID=1122934 RepID=A0A1M6JGA9_9FIRM|nr:HPP family protein [Parasporobacterium paucivorans]SHJ45726.1 HPP family protein [Parasporobacterium paucivorans DSM 15970]